jgi:calcineurin-like phosphoesterase
VKDNFYEELESVFDKFPKYYMIILLDFNAKVTRESTALSKQATHRFHMEKFNLKN